MLDNDGRSSTEATRGTKTRSSGSDQHVDLGGRDVIELGKTTTSSSDGSKRKCFVENEAILVLVLELYLWNGSN